MDKLLKQKRELEEIIFSMTHWISQIRLNNYLDYFDINKMSENLSLKLLNELYDLNLVNVNYDKRNTPSVDLIDDKNSIAFQITSRTDAKKIKESLEKFVENKLNLRFSNGVRFVILNFDTVKKGRYKYSDIYPYFDFEKHVITDKKIISDIEKLLLTDEDKFYKILQIFKDTMPQKNIPDDENILKEIINCFDRPAFTTPFNMESNLPDFVKAIEDTIAAVNTGVYRMRDGTLIKNISSKSSITDQKIKKSLDNVVFKLIDLRYTYEELVKKGKIKHCRCNDPSCGVHISSPEACTIMNDKRRIIFKDLCTLLPEFTISIYY